MSTASAVIKRPRRPGPHRASAYFLVIVLALSGAGAWYLWPSTPGSRIVCVATASLSAYHEITNADIRLAKVRSNQLPGNATADPDSLVGRYTLAATQRGQPFDADYLGPRLAPGALTAQVIVGLPVPGADVADGVISRGDRIDILLSSTAAEDPRSSILPDATVLDVKADGSQAGQVVVVCAFEQRYEDALLTSGGTARVFIALVPPSGSR